MLTGRKTRCTLRYLYFIMLTHEVHASTPEPPSPPFKSGSPLLILIAPPIDHSTTSYAVLKT
ncbi:hypothetical protein PF005_g19577 [Phytophthora fragariae]|uniref:RxLR effector protein n=1 Tax=Phytophthora fragariae TaxID=53985 RepID=A0A6A3R0I0_9STRA|nr:hypothetical protein PF003_g3572 [Phytophthora fragariae]KAE8928994.1 hypothetical protein PF009_g20887 [Phytophthora fragariae]KAE8987900.1 hypothetical protein PF011_g19393 [Phytophthora fragariae]KAE9087020.1 hypothetical protein PF007_g20537 [Phytophthora fragariae]KAE9088315.1 hypothetical protein PF010_g19421 [Phytophthora fragariae]